MVHTNDEFPLPDSPYYPLNMFLKIVLGSLNARPELVGFVTYDYLGTDYMDTEEIGPINRHLPMTETLCDAE